MPPGVGLGAKVGESLDDGGEIAAGALIVWFDTKHDGSGLFAQYKSVEIATPGTLSV